MKHLTEYKIASEILLEVLSGKNLSDVFNRYIDKQVSLSSNGVSLNIAKVKDISYGVLRHHFELTAILNKLCQTKPDNKILVILIIGIYELLYTQKPKFAVTNDLVSFSYQETKKDGLKNFVNAVFRNFLRQNTKLCQDLTNNLEFKYNFPNWFINKLKLDYKENWEQIIEASNQKPRLSLRLKNTHDINDYIGLLDAQEITYNIRNGVIVLDNSLPVSKIPLFMDGEVSIQDIHAQKILEIAPIEDGQYILDACSAPGGKTCQILENYKVDLIALDIDNNRLDKVKQNLGRLKLSAKVLCGDAGKLDWWDGKEFDLVIADVPCSATGTIKHNPDIKLHRDPGDIANFVVIQRKIVSNLWQTIKPNGFLVYITCSIFKEENQNNIEFFASHLPNLKVIKEIRLLPDDHGDGFYYCLLQKFLVL